MSPDGNEDRPEHRPSWIYKEEDLVKSQFYKPSVQNAVTKQDPFPDQRDNHRRKQHRKEENRAKKAARPDFAIQDQRRDQREQHHETHLENDEYRGVVDTFPESVLATGLGVCICLAVQQKAVLFGPDKGPVIQIKLRAAGQRIKEIDK